MADIEPASDLASSARPADPDAARHLENLRVALGQADPALLARLVGLGRSTPPYLHVNNPAAGRLTEDISVADIEPGCHDPYYRFSWGQPITPQAAAAKVLAVRARPM